MYEFVEGQIAGRSAARVVVDVQGVGYDVLVPLSARFPATGRVRVWTHLVVREDSHALFGFEDRETRDLFRVLLSVRGVGPVMALGILSGLPRAELVAAIADGDLKALTRIRGVGKKTGEQILLDLREKAAQLRHELAAPGAPRAALPAAAESKAVTDAVAALISIGYSEKEAKKSVERAALSVDATNLEVLVRAALSS